MNKLLLHCCCAPCSTVAFERLTPDYGVTAYYCNPNITDEEEYRLRLKELVRLAGEFGVDVIDGGYTPEKFFAAAKGLEAEPERGARCAECFRLRLDATAAYSVGSKVSSVPAAYVTGSNAKLISAAAAETKTTLVPAAYAAKKESILSYAVENKFNFFATTLTLSPLKDAVLINKIGFEAAARYGAEYLPSDFKKRDGNRRSAELCARFGLYRQNYCGCVFSKR